MDHIQVYYDARGMVMLELGGHGLELERAEAEALFVSLGHALQDMDHCDQERRVRETIEEEMN